jgi:hypothetical protein
LTDLEQYQKLVAWAGQAMAAKPHAFDAVTQWILTMRRGTAEPFPK